MQLPRVTDLAAKQAIDAIRLFREFVRVQRELQAYEGSLFFKKVGGYEYLLHKLHGRVHYKGTRSAATEAEYAAFNAQKLRLKTRADLLKPNVETQQRMNKAVHAGLVPTEIMEVLTQLERHGLNDKCFVLGGAALYAYCQSSGIQMEGLTMPGQSEALLPRQPDTLCVLVQTPQHGAADLLRQLQHSLRTVAQVEASGALSSSCWVWSFRFDGAAPTASSKKSAHAKTRKLTADARNGAKMRNAMPRQSGSATSHSIEAEAWLALLQQTPVYEQVVIGRTGKMAVMRTLDPQLFVRLAHTRQLHGDVDADETAQHSQLVEQLLESSLVISKLDGAAQEALDHQLLALAVATEASGDPI